jgi:hypothetical protein
MNTRFKRGARAALAGLLVLGGALTTVTIGGALPASAASVTQTTRSSRPLLWTAFPSALRRTAPTSGWRTLRATR